MLNVELMIKSFICVKYNLKYLKNQFLSEDYILYIQVKKKVNEFEYNSVFLLIVANNRIKLRLLKN